MKQGPLFLGSRGRLVFPENVPSWKDRGPIGEISPILHANDKKEEQNYSASSPKIHLLDWFQDQIRHA